MQNKLIAAIAILVLVVSVTGEARAEEVPELVKDIFAGTGNSLPTPPTFPRLLVASGENVFFGANDGTSGVELWRSGGSEQGAFRVKDIFPGPGSSSPQFLTDVGGTLFFTADDGTSGRELWRSDGTEAGTYRVTEISPGPASAFAEDLIAVGGTLFFGAHDGSAYGLWRSDGTAGGTFLIKYLGFPRALVAVGGMVFFVASDFPSGRELWRSDGTAAGTVRVKDIVPGSGSPTILDSLIAAGNLLFFRVWPPSAGVELWRSDGTEAGTVRVKNVFVTPPHGGVSCATAPVSSMADFGGMLFFTGDDLANPGMELWRSDGTEAGTLRVKDISPGLSGSQPQCLTAAGGLLFFSAGDATNGVELWRSDGTETGTLRVRDIVPALGSSAPHYLVDVGGMLYFSATDATGTELWRSDGTEIGTLRVADIRPGAASSSPQFLVNAGGTLFFSGDDGLHGREPWRLGSNQPPSVGAVTVSPDSSAEGTEVDVTSSFTQPGSHTHTCTINWGDGTPTELGTIAGGACTASHPYGDNGSFVVTVSVTDEDGKTGTSSSTHVVTNAPAVVGPVTLSPESSVEGTAVTATTTFDDPGAGDGPFSCTVNYGDGSGELAGTIAGNTCTGPSHVHVDSGSYAVTVLVIDKDGGIGANTTMHSVANAAPLITSISGPIDPVQIGAAVPISAVFTDQGTADTHTCTISWGDSSITAGVVIESGGSGICSGTYVYAVPGIYSIIVTVTDSDGDFDLEPYAQYAVIYNAGGGLVTGGGWFDSPVAAYPADPSLEGKASFGFASKYRNDGVLVGQTEFHFKPGNLIFRSSAYEWLIVSGAKARYRGIGQLNGATGYSFEVTVWDGQANGGGGIDRFRIKIWESENGHVIYDNQSGAPDGADPITVLEGGSIVIHKEN